MSIRRSLSRAFLVVFAGLVAACATTPPDPGQLIRDSKKSAWSVRASQDEMVVAASPARKTLQFAGSTGLILGASVDAVVNSKYRDAIRAALSGYDTNEVFRTHLEQRMQEATGGKIEGVAPLGSTAGYNNEREAMDARYASLAKQGYDAVLDVRMRYGLYGTRAEMVAELDADLIDLASGRRVWDGTYFAVPRPLLASDRLGNPLGKKRSSESAPQFRVDEDAFAAWTAKDGERLRAAFEEAVSGVTAALLNDLGLERSAVGQYYLGKIAMSDEDFNKANELFNEALRLEPSLIDARNAQAVDFAEGGQLDKAIELAEGLTQSNPDYAAAWYNLAWWYAIDKKDAARAKPYYLQARKLGMPADAKLEEAFAG